MKYKAMLALAALSVMSMQPGYTQGCFRGQPSKASPSHAGPAHSGEPLELGNFCAFCCGQGSIGSAQTLHVPQQGFVVELATSGGAHAETSVENLCDNPTNLFKTIRFDLNGPIDNFSVYVGFTTPHGDCEEMSGLPNFTLANGGFHKGPGHTYFINTQNIPAGSRITQLVFILDQNCNSNAGPQVVDISNVYIDKTFVHYEVDNGVIEDEGAFCQGGGG